MAEESTADPIRPAYYKTGEIEVIECIEAWGLGFCLGNSIKYIVRAGKKDPATYKQDLLKAKWYLEREISHCL